MTESIKAALKELFDVIVNFVKGIFEKETDGEFDFITK